MTTTGSPELGRAFGASAEGDHHGGRPGNQDAFEVAVASGRASIAVADGHGSSACFRSEMGSRFAVQTVLELLRESTAPLAELQSERAQVVFRHALVDRWRARVLAHIAASPFSDREFAGNATQMPAESLRALIAQEPTLAYGSTLLFASADGDHVLYLQIGDGDTIAVDSDGNARTIFPKPPTMLANETYSLCQEDAWQYVRMAVQERLAGEPAFIVCATDGFGNAFPSPGAARHRAATLEALRGAADHMARADVQSLVDSASAASLDDATLAMLVPPPLQRPEPAAPAARATVGPLVLPSTALEPAEAASRSDASQKSRPGTVAMLLAAVAGIVLGVLIGHFTIAPHAVPANLGTQSPHHTGVAPLPPGAAHHPGRRGDVAPLPSDGTDSLSPLPAASPAEEKSP